MKYQIEWFDGHWNTCNVCDETDLGRVSKPVAKYIEAVSVAAKSGMEMSISLMNKEIGRYETICHILYGNDGRVLEYKLYSDAFKNDDLRKCLMSLV